MISRLFFLMILLSSLSASAQDDPHINLMITEDSWRKEAFTFPKPFAPEVDFKGEADVRFTKGWSDVESDLIWSYAFAWKIDLEEKLTDTELEYYLELYFDGLMRVVNRDTTLSVPLTNALFISSAMSKSQLKYTGKIKLYDAFFTSEMITLNVNGEYDYCDTTNKHLYIFRLSPKPIGDEAWNHINKTVLREDLCK